VVLEIYYMFYLGFHSNGIKKLIKFSMIIDSPARVSFPDSPVFSPFSLETESFRLIGLAVGGTSTFCLQWLWDGSLERDDVEMTAATSNKELLLGKLPFSIIKQQLICDNKCSLC